MVETIVLWLILAIQIIFILIALFTKSFIKAWVEGDIDEHYKKSAEKRAYDQLVRVKAELIGELLAEWVSLPTDKRKLRKLANEAFLWLPADLATELSKVLTHEPDAIGYRELMSKIRTYLHGQDDSFESYRFVTWENTESE